MKDKEILGKIKKTIDSAPIDILDDIKSQKQTKMISHDDITRQDTWSEKIKKVMPYASVAVLFFLVILGWQFQTGTADSLIYLDVNPSIYFTSNKIDQVIELESDTQEGRKIIESIDFQGKSIDLVTEEVLDRMMEEEYLSENDDFILLSVHNKNMEKEDSERENLDSLIHTYLETKGIKAIVLGQNFRDRENMEKLAQKYKISESKMSFIQKLIDQEPNLQLNNLLELSLEELVKLSQEKDIDLNKIIKTKDMQRIRAIQRLEEDKESIEKDNTEKDDEGEEIKENTIDNKPAPSPTKEKAKDMKAIPKAKPIEKKSHDLGDDEDDDDKDDDSDDEDDDDDDNDEDD